MPRRVPLPLAALVAALACGTEAGTNPEAELVFSVDAHDFGNVSLGLPSDSVRLVLVNRGGVRSGTISVALAGPDATEFAIARDLCTGQALRSGGTCAVDVRLRPTSAGAKSAEITAAVPPGITVTTTLTGVGRDDGLRFASDSLRFGDQLVGSPSRTLTAVVRNGAVLSTGAMSVALGAPAGSAFSIVRDECNGRLLAFAASCEIDVRFSFAAASVGDATLTVSGAPGGTATARLTGGAGGPTTLASSPASRDFGLQRVRTLWPPGSFTLTNSGAVPSGQLRLAFGGANAAEFSLTADACINRRLAPGESCAVTVAFRTSVGGVRSGTLQVSDGYGSAASVPLTGTGGTVVFTLTPAGKDFGTRILGAAAETLAVLRNTGTVASGQINSFNFCTGAAQLLPCAPEFESESVHCGTLQPGASCEVLLRFKPVALGERGAAILFGDGLSSVLASAVGIGGGLTAPFVFGFPASAIGEEGVTQSLTINNTAGQPTSIVETELIGDDFELVSDACHGAVVPGFSSCRVSLRAVAQDVAGDVTGILRVSATRGGTVTMSLRATVR